MEQDQNFKLIDGIFTAEAEKFLQLYNYKSIIITERISAITSGLIKASSILKTNPRTQ
jgi:hypothetical protein